jgi:hypothetical protein
VTVETDKFPLPNQINISWDPKAEYFDFDIDYTQGHEYRVFYIKISAKFSGDEKEKSFSQLTNWADKAAFEEVSKDIRHYIDAENNVSIKIMIKPLASLDFLLKQV